MNHQRENYKIKTENMDLELTFPDKYSSIEDWTDSMLFSSGTILAILKGTYYEKNVSVELKVVGDVKVYYDGIVYKDVTQFPDELVTYIEEVGCFNNDDFVEFIDNNWFNFDVYEGEEFLQDFVCESNLSEYSKGDLVMDMIEYLDYVFEKDKESDIDIEQDK